jgi:SH3 domain-containing YSC84-like protein 1
MVQSTGMALTPSYFGGFPMRRVSFGIVVAFLGLLGLARPVRADSSRSDDLQRIRNARTVFHQIMDTPDSGIPQELLESAKCIAIIPGEKQFAFLLGGQYGKGLVTCRTAHGWSAPVFLTATGGSLGLQIGGSSTDLVMIFRNREGIQRLLNDRFKIGADVTAAVGPVGRHAAAATDLEMHAEILTYSRSRGIFAGVSLDGTVVEPDRRGDQALYGTNVSRKAILNGKVPAPKAAQSFLAEINRYTREEPA